MLDELRERIVEYLSRHQVCVIATSGSLGAWAVAARYENRGLELNCLLPRWSDAVFHLEQSPQVMAIIQDVETVPWRWLQYQGTAQVVDATDDRYVAVRILPQRIDLIDESRGWGARETLDL